MQTDPKTSVEDGIPSSTSVNDLEGYDDWVDVLCTAQSTFPCKCVVYDETSPSGDPFVGDPRILGHPASLSRSTVALRAWLMSPVCTPSFSLDQIASRTPHSLKGTLATIARCAHESKEVQLEIGSGTGRQPSS